MVRRSCATQYNYQNALRAALVGIMQGVINSYSLSILRVVRLTKKGFLVQKRKH